MGIGQDVHEAEGRAVALGRTIPALPVRDVRAAAAHFRERFGFDAPQWGATDTECRSRADLADRPIRSGAEPFVAGTASCRIEPVERSSSLTPCEPGHRLGR